MGAGYSDRKGKREERKSFSLFPSVLRPSSLSVEGSEAHYPCTCRGRYAPCSLELICQNQPAVQQCFSLTTNQHQPFSSVFTACRTG
jgi:hypothetical protein